MIGWMNLRYQGKKCWVNELTVTWESEWIGTYLCGSGWVGKAQKGSSWKLCVSNKINSCGLPYRSFGRVHSWRGYYKSKINFLLLTRALRLKGRKLSYRKAKDSQKNSLLNPWWLWNQLGKSEKPDNLEVIFLGTARQLRIAFFTRQRAAPSRLGQMPKALNYESLLRHQWLSTCIQSSHE